MMYSNTPQNDYIGKEQQQYGNSNNSRQQQQYLVQQQYIQQQNNMHQSSNTNGGYSYESNNSGNNGGDGYNSQKQSRFTRPMQIQQQQLQQSKLDSGLRQRGNYPLSQQQGLRNDKNRSYNPNSMNNNQNNEHLYGDLGGNGEMSSRDLSSDQRPSEGE